MRRLHADLLLLAAAAIWGFAFLFQKSAMGHVGPFLFVAARAVVASLALAPLALIEHRRAATPVPTDLWGRAGLAGAAFFVAAVLQQAGLVTATVTNTGFLTALYVVLTPLLAFAATGRRPAPITTAAVVLSFTGTWLLGGGTLAGFSKGDGLVALCAVFWACHVLLVGRAAALGRPVLFTTLQFGAVAALGLVLAPLVETVSLAAIAQSWMEIAYVGLLSSALTFTIFTMALRSTTPTEATIIVSTETLFAAFGAYIVLGERLSPTGMLGAGLILAAVGAVQLGASAPSSEGDANASAGSSVGERK